MAEALRLRWVASVLGVVAVSACAAPPPPPAPAPPPGPPAGVEGRYRGTARLVRADNRYCPRSGPRVYEVQNGVVTLSYQGPGRARIPITATIQGDGNFDKSDGEGRLQGHVGDGELTMTIASQACEHHWTMRLVS